MTPETQLRTFRSTVVELEVSFIEKLHDIERRSSTAVNKSWQRLLCHRDLLKILATSDPMTGHLLQQIYHEYESYLALSNTNTGSSGGTLFEHPTHHPYDTSSLEREELDETNVRLRERCSELEQELEILRQSQQNQPPTIEDPDCPSLDLTHLPEFERI